MDFQKQQISEVRAKPDFREAQMVEALRAPRVRNSPQPWAAFSGELCDGKRRKRNLGDPFLTTCLLWLSGVPSAGVGVPGRGYYPGKELPGKAMGWR